MCTTLVFGIGILAVLPPLFVAAIIDMIVLLPSGLMRLHSPFKAGALFKLFL
jgi:hypothetical protein